MPTNMIRTTQLTNRGYFLPSRTEYVDIEFGQDLQHEFYYKQACLYLVCIR